MKFGAVALLSFLLSLRAFSDELSLRYNNVAASGGLFDIVFSTPGKLVETCYDYEPDAFSNLYVEAALGEYFYSDFDSPLTPLLEGSVGVQVQAGPIRFRLSQGVVRMFSVNGTGLNDFVTHLGLSVLDPKSRVSLGLERTHYSSGSTSNNLFDVDMTGITFGLKI